MSNGCIFQPTRPLRGATTAPHLRMGSINFNPRAPCGARPCCSKCCKGDALFQPTRPLRGATRLRQLPPMTHRFQPTRPLRGATDHCPHYAEDIAFQPTRPLRGATAGFPLVGHAGQYFNPRAPCGARPPPTRTAGGRRNFNPRAPCGARPKHIKQEGNLRRFQPTRPLRGATISTLLCAAAAKKISTHAPLAGRDSVAAGLPEQRENFNPRAPCGARPKHIKQEGNLRRFQPTRPLRGATISTLLCAAAAKKISTHAPLAGRDSVAAGLPEQRENFNPRAPCGARPNPDLVVGAFILFQPTRPLRGATRSTSRIENFTEISTHAPLAGRDGEVVPSLQARMDFNPRAPCGARQYLEGHNYGRTNISTHAPLAGRDVIRRGSLHVKWISTHAPLAGRDGEEIGLSETQICNNFNPRAPCGARRSSASQNRKPPILFQPTRPLRGATVERDDDRIDRHISTHAPLAGRDSKSVQITMHIFAITDKFQMLLHRMPPVRAFCSFLMQENHADFGCEPPK